jgi:TRAP transporter TAXI family solute receptor
VTGARLAGARLAGARLAGARLAGARLAGTRLASAGLTRRGFLRGVGALAASGAAFALAGCGLGASGARFTMASGEPGGTYVEFGELLRAALQRRGAFELDLRTTLGSVDNLGLLARGEAQLAISLADALDPSAPAPVAIGRVYQNYLQCAVLADSGMRVLADLAGHRVSVGAPGSGAAITARRVLEAAGLATGEGAAITSEIDALFWSSGIPAPAIASLRERVAIRFVALADVLPALDSAYPDTYLSTALPRGAYGGVDDVPTVGTPNFLLASRDLPDDAAASLVDVLIEEAETLVPAGSVGVQYLTAANLIDTSPVPLHPAAAARYRTRYG